MPHLVEKVQKFLNDKGVKREFNITKSELVQEGVYRAIVFEQMTKTEPVKFGMQMAIAIGTSPKYSGTPVNGNMFPYTLSAGSEKIVVQLFYERALPLDDFDFR